ncbi:hypothetical protein [Granulosicoccus antarcticus]|uniref:Uncharacterized protein n=1 Tax=Granulosicoccus antarcticus IMCC3135 TaxID=1192854 RepID=A0A2Z2NHB3_9GAMM|nr:hypothetical protein [Granulosicoccus antarcticus]ASJ70529.1 hypothetical protein IMCC3135_02075 [Granulosicoccus antarcticus IMCC3135]
MVQSEKLNYVYRLSAARLAILRLRIKRFWNQLFAKNRQVPAKAAGKVSRDGRQLSGIVIVGGLLGSAMLGYSLGQPAGKDTIVHTPSTNPDTQLIERKQVPVLNVAMAPVRQALKPVLEPEPELVDQKVELARKAEVTDLLQTVDKLEARIQSLEQETSGLEVELLNQQLAFTKEEARWKEAAIERRVIYNITNIPVGSSVIEQVQGASELAPDAGASGYQDPRDADPYDRYREGDGSQEQWNGDDYLADVLEQQSESDGQPQSDTGSFDGPAPDRYEDLINQ